jgi:hypothetical protein
MSRRPKRLAKPKSPLSSFTYYIPSPPQRKSGYREKEFDKILTGILKSGFQIVEMKTQAVGNENGAGMFVMAILKAPNAKIGALDENQEVQDLFKLSDTHSSPDIILEDNNGENF